MNSLFCYNDNDNHNHNHNYSHSHNDDKQLKWSLRKKLNELEGKGQMRLNRDNDWKKIQPQKINKINLKKKNRIAAKKNKNSLLENWIVHKISLFNKKSWNFFSKLIKYYTVLKNKHKNKMLILFIVLFFLKTNRIFWFWDFNEIMRQIK